MLKNNLDLNIWDKIGHETEYKKEGWCISVYRIPAEGSAYGSGEFVTNLDLQTREARRLTLGLSKSEGGDYTPDSDFWIDALGFFVVYRSIPRRIERNITLLLEGGMK